MFLRILELPPHGVQGPSIAQLAPKGLQLLLQLLQPLRTLVGVPLNQPQGLWPPALGCVHLSRLQQGLPTPGRLGATMLALGAGGEQVCGRSAPAQAWGRFCRRGPRRCWARPR